MEYSKRKFILGGVCLLGINQISANLALAANSPKCTAIEKLMLSARFEAENYTSWPVLYGNSAINNLRTAIDSLDSEIQSLSGVVSKAQRARILSFANAAGSAAILAAGITAGPATAGALAITSVAFSGSMLLASTFSAPEDLSLTSITVDRAGVLSGSILQSMGDKAYAVSARSANYAKIAGPIVGFGFVVYGFIDWAQKRDYHELKSKELDELKAQIKKTRQALEKMTTNKWYEDLRKACASAVASDLEVEMEKNSCAVVLNGPA